MKIEIDKKVEECVFPLILEEKHTDGVRFRLTFLGSAFFICQNGLFLSAKHIFDNIKQDNRKNLKALIIFDKKQSKLLPIDFVSHPTNDLTVGWVKINTNFRKPPVLGLSTKQVDTSNVVCTYGYPNTHVFSKSDTTQIHFETKVRLGIINKYYPSGAAFGAAVPPFYEHSIDIFPGLSGGPLVSLMKNEQTLVIGVNSGTSMSEYSQMRDGIASKIDPILDVQIPFANKKTLREIADENHIYLDS